MWAFAPSRRAICAGLFACGALPLLGAACTPAEAPTVSSAAVPPERPAAPALEERPDFARAFQEAGVTGTFVLYDPQAARVLVHDSSRARERFLPASTFKIPHSLIALETGAVADTAEVFWWDGTERSVAAWNRDHTLATAFEHSVVWAYQDVARRIGDGQMAAHVGRMGYGNGSIGGGIDRFWLTGDLRISALEQVRFIQRLHERRLPFSERTLALVEGLMIERRGPDTVLRGKTGWADRSATDPELVDIGWYVGFVVREGKPTYFALNVDLERPEQAAMRRALAQTILQKRGLL